MAAQGHAGGRDSWDNRYQLVNQAVRRDQATGRGNKGIIR